MNVRFGKMAMNIRLCENKIKKGMLKQSRPQKDGKIKEIPCELTIKAIINVEKSHNNAIFLFLYSFCYAQTSPLGVHKYTFGQAQSLDFGSVCVF